MAAQAAPPDLQGQITLRPLTPSEIKDYSLTGLQGASGLSAVGLGQPAYLEVLINAAIAPSNITSVTWVLTNKPIGSAAVLTTSPLGTNVPTYKMADRFNNSGAAVYQVAGPTGRTLLRPDVAGQYTVVATIVTAGSGTTNLTQNISGATYMGVQVCSFCHSGGTVAEDEYVPWSQTPHATFFTRAIDGQVSSHYGKNCISCHTAGYDANTNAVNGGFDDIATQVGWTFPTVLTNGNWAAMPSALKNLANIQCENCHGPGSEHAMAFGNTNLSNWPRIGKTFAAGDCAQCHDSKNSHIKSAEWNTSKHAVTTRSPSGPSRAACARCHTASGFAAFSGTVGTTNAWTGTNIAYTDYEAISCQTCHDPHDASNPHQLRVESVVLGAGIVITNAGSGSLCMNCHQSRTGSYTNSLERYPLGLLTYAGGSSSFGPHDNPAADMIEGVNGYTYGKDIPSAAHRSAITNTCVGCHMQTVASTDPAFLQAGGHTFSMTYTVGTNVGTNVVDKVDVCVQCHGPIASFDMVRQDYDGDGVIDGVQTEVQHLIDRLSTLFPSSTYRADANYVADGLVKSPSVKTNWPAKFLRAAWNYQLVKNDLSKGIHNTPYAVGLLKASIGDLTGDNNEDGLPDAWQIQYFGSVTNPAAAPNAIAAGDGAPNWLKYNLGLNPLVAGITNATGGVVWANGTTLDGTSSTNIQIFTAAEVAFGTEVGLTYYVEGVSSLSGGWQVISPAIQGTGTTISYLTPTRTNVQQFFRVYHNP